MGNTLASLFVDIGYRDQSVNTGLAKTHGQLQQTQAQIEATGRSGSSMWSMLGGGAHALAAAACIGTIGLSLAKIISLTAEAETAQVHLKTAFEVSGQSIGNVAGVNALANSMQSLYGVQKNTVVEAASFATILGVQANALGVTLKTASGLGKVMGMDLHSATEAVMKATEGNTHMLERQLPKLKELHTEQEKLAYIEKIAAAGLQESAAERDTMSGSWNQMTLAAGDLGRTLGDFVSPGIKAVMGGITDMIFDFNQAIPSAEALSAQLSLLGAEAEMAWTQVKKTFSADDDGDEEAAAKAVEDAQGRLIDARTKAQKQQHEANDAQKQHLEQAKQINKEYSTDSAEKYWEKLGESLRAGTLEMGVTAKAAAGVKDINTGAKAWANTGQQLRQGGPVDAKAGAGQAGVAAIGAGVGGNAVNADPVKAAAAAIDAKRAARMRIEAAQQVAQDIQSKENAVQYGKHVQEKSTNFGNLPVYDPVRREKQNHYYGAIQAGFRASDQLDYDHSTDQGKKNIAALNAAVNRQLNRAANNNAQTHRDALDRAKREKEYPPTTKNIAALKAADAATRDRLMRGIVDDYNKTNREITDPAGAVKDSFDKRISAVTNDRSLTDAQRKAAVDSLQAQSDAEQKRAAGTNDRRVEAMRQDRLNTVGEPTRNNRDDRDDPSLPWLQEMTRHLKKIADAKNVAIAG